MRVSKYIQEEGKSVFTLGIDGEIQQVLVNSYIDGVSEKLKNTKVSVLLNSVRIIDNYQGSSLESLNVLLEKYFVNETTKFEILTERVDVSKPYNPLLFTLIYIDKDNEKNFRGPR